MKKRWLSFLLLGVLLFASGFVYTTMAESIAAIRDASEAYFEETNQEDFSIEVSDRLTASEKEHVRDVCGLQTTETLSALSSADSSCHEDILSSRKETLIQVFTGVSLEARLFMDIPLFRDDGNHRMRILNDADSINKSHIEEGNKPLSSGEIAILGNYARANDIALEDEFVVQGETFIVTGFVLFPDYNLPVFDHPFLFDSTKQTLALMSDEDFAMFDAPKRAYFAGVLEEVSASELEGMFDQAAFLTAPFLENLTLTENNMRSGAIYAEIEGGHAFALIVAAFIALLGLLIIVLSLLKTLRANSRPFGVLKALGVPDNALIFPFLALIGIFALLFLLLGFLAGQFAAHPMQDIFRDFYLLPEGKIRFRVVTLVIALALPLTLLLGLSFVVMKRLLGKRPVALIHPALTEWAKGGLKRFRIGSWRLSFLVRMQIAFIKRRPGKFAVFVVGLFGALFAGFFSFGMHDMLERTLPEYYGGTGIEVKAYTEDITFDEPAEGEKVLELSVRVNETNASLVALSEGQTLHPLKDSRGRDLTGSLAEGLVISRGFSDLSGLREGDTVEVTLAGDNLEMEITGVADIYAGSHVFATREVVAEWLFTDPSAYNVVYLSESPEVDYALLVFTDDIVEQLRDTHEIFNVFFRVLVASALFIALVVVYLLTVMLVEDHYYPLAMFKVLGYDNSIIRKILLGGYVKAALLCFVVGIPVALLAFAFTRRWMAEMYEFMVPLAITPVQVLIYFALFLATLFLGTMSAKRKIDKMSLKDALAIYQE